MKLKLNEILALEQPLGNLLESRMPLKIAFKFAAILKSVKEPISTFNERRESLIRELGEEKEGSIAVKPENVEQFRQQMLDALAVEVDINFEPISVEDLPDTLQVSPVDLDKLSVLFK